MKHTIVIIEDEALVARDLHKLIKNLSADIEVAATLDSVEHALFWFTNNPSPDLIFADVQLSDGVSFDIFKQVEVKSPIIFTTAYDEYAIRAFKLNSIDYLLKPIDTNDLKNAWNKFLNTKQVVNITDNITQLISDLSKGTKKYKERFAVHSGASIISVHTNEVSFFKRDDYIFLTATDGKQYLCDYNSLEELDEILDPKMFFRANRQYLIQLNAVQGYKTGYNGKVEVKLKYQTTDEITVSREKASMFKEWFEGN